MTETTGAGLENLEPLVQLRYLDLQGTNVTDATLEHLKGLTQIRRLHLPSSVSMDEAAVKLRRALPNCAIH